MEVVVAEGYHFGPAQQAAVGVLLQLAVGTSLYPQAHLHLLSIITQESHKRSMVVAASLVPS